MELFNRYENIVLEALTLALQDSIVNEGITLEKIDMYFREILGEEYDKSLESSEAENGFFGVFRQEGDLYCPVLKEDEDGYIHDLPVLLTTLEKEAIINALHSPYARYFLEEKDIRELCGKTGDFQPSWQDSEIFRRHRYVTRTLTDEAADTLRRLRICIAEGTAVSITNISREKEYPAQEIYPLALEYTVNEDLWTLNAWLPSEERAINIRVDRIRDMEEIGEIPEDIPGKYKRFIEKKKRLVTMRVRSERHALERLFRLFSYYQRELDYEKETNTYILKVYYYDFDQNALMRNLLSAGHLITVIEPEELRQEMIRNIRESLDRYE